MPVVVVESPAKAKTINKYLGSDYTVLASYGHVRDLPAKDGSVDTEQDFEMKWEVGADSRKHVKAIADALSNDNSLILATDPDREGEAISWHLEETLRKRKVLKKDTPVSRGVFKAITKSGLSGAPRVGLSCWLQPFTSSMAQVTWRKICRACAISLSAPDCRARDRNRGIQRPRVLVGQSRFRHAPRTGI